MRRKLHYYTIWPLGGDFDGLDIIFNYVNPPSISFFRNSWKTIISFPRNKNLSPCVQPNVERQIYQQSMKHQHGFSLVGTKHKSDNLQEKSPIYKDLKKKSNLKYTYVKINFVSNINVFKKFE